MKTLFTRRTPILWSSGINAACGITLIVLPAAAAIPTTVAALDIAAGVVIATLAMTRAAGASFRPWIGWANAALGLAAAVIPWLIVPAQSGALAVNTLLGVAVVLCGAVSATSAPAPDRPALAA